MKHTAIFLIAGLTAVQASEPFVVALKPDKNPENMLAERKVLSAALAQATGRPVEVIVPLSSSVIIEGLLNGSIDVAYLSASDLLTARKAGAAALLLAGEIDGNTWYSSYWLCAKDKPYRSVNDLRGKPVAFASRTSTSGFVIPLWDLHKKGLIEARPEEFFGEGNVFYGTGYVSAVERVLAGEAEAAAVSDYVFDKEKHLTPEQRAKLKVVQSQGPVPTHVIAASTRLSDDERAAWKAALLGLNDGDTTLRDTVFTSKLVETDEAAHTASLVEAQAVAAGATP